MADDDQKPAIDESPEDQQRVASPAIQVTTNAPQTRLTEFGKITARGLEREMEESYLDYAMSVIVSRALPDVRDGLKPVHRRVLYAMWETGLKSGSKYRKSAAVVGEVLKSYHPHGDIAVYDTLVRLAQPFAMRNPLVDGQGNFGSIDGDSPAAMRYTEVRMAGIAEELLVDIEKETVAFIPNYDGSTVEPTVLPAKLPNLLLNGALGIAVGMATNIPPHNLRELCDALVHLLEHDDATVEALMEFVTGPDFPTGGLIFNTEDIRTAYTTGKGRIVMRGIAEIEEQTKGYQIIISALPYQVNKAELIIKIAELVKLKKLEGISDIRDESDRKDGVRIVIDLKQSAFPRKILNQLFALTPLESAFHVNLLALVDGIQPRILTLKQVLEEYLKHRISVVRRRTEFELRRAQERAHILEGLKIALDQIDEVITTIRASKSRDDARVNLIKKFKLSELQANAILEMRLAALAALERQRVDDELNEKLALIAELKAILASPERIREILKTELIVIRDRFGSDRRTKVIPNAVSGFRAEDLIPNEQVIVTVTSGGYIKRVPVGTYRSQHRGGKGIVGMATKDEDAVEFLLSTWTHNDILFFTNRGRLFTAKVYDLPSASRTAKGQAMPNIIQIGPEEKVTAMIALDKTTRAQAKYFFMGTEKGVVKKTAIDAYANIRKSGIIALKLRENDTLQWVALTSGNDRIMLGSSAGQAILFKETDTRPMGRSASGVMGMRLRAGDKVMAMTVIPASLFETPEETTKKRGRKPDGPMLLTVLENGFGKRTPIDEFRGQRRGGIGVRAARANAKTGKVVTALVSLGDLGDLILVSKAGVVIRIPLKSAKKLGRDAQGVTLMRFKGRDQVSSVTVVQKSDETSEDIPASPTSIVGDVKTILGETTEPPVAPRADPVSEPTDAGTGADAALSRQSGDAPAPITEVIKETPGATSSEKSKPTIKKIANRVPKNPKRIAAQDDPDQPNYWGTGTLWEKPKK